MKPLRLSEGLKVLAFLQPVHAVDLESVAKKANMEKQKVNRAIGLLSKSAIISNPFKRLRIHVKQMNGNAIEKQKPVGKKKR